MSNVSVKVEGLKELQRALDELPVALAHGVMSKFLRERAEPIANTARQLVPVDKGELRNSITVSSRLTRRQFGEHRKDGPNDVEIFVGPGSLPQAHLQEFGTINAPAQPFMRPAWDQHRNSVLEGIKVDLWRLIEKAAARFSKKLSSGG